MILKLFKCFISHLTTSDY